MLNAVVGAVIMVVATTSLLYSLELAERAFDEAGRYALNDDETEVLRKAGIRSDAEADMFWRVNIKEAPREVGLDE